MMWVRVIAHGLDARRQRLCTGIQVDHSVTVDCPPGTKPMQRLANRVLNDGVLSYSNRLTFAPKTAQLAMA